MLVGHELFVANAGRLFDGTGRLSDAATRDRLRLLLDRYTEWIDVPAPARHPEIQPP